MFQSLSKYEEKKFPPTFQKHFFSHTSKKKAKNTKNVANSQPTASNVQKASLKSFQPLKRESSLSILREVRQIIYSMRQNSMENRCLTINVSEASTKNQVQPKTEPQSMTNPSAVMDLDDRINARGDEKDRLKKKLRYIAYLFHFFHIIFMPK